MVTFKYRWMTAFGISLFAHAIAIVFIAVAAFLFPHTSVDKSPLEVDLVSIAGGGGGGGSPEAAPEIDTPEAQTSEIPPEPVEDMVDEEVVNDVHEIADEFSEDVDKSAEKSQVLNANSNNSSRGHGSGTGTGGGHGSGHGTGTGSGTGPGTGSGSGGGNGYGVGTGDTIGPQLLSSPEPVYPESARDASIEGTAVVGLIISVDGGVSSAWIESSSGSGALDDAAVNAVYNWRFVPAKQNGTAIEARSRVPVSFSLRS